MERQMTEEELLNAFDEGLQNHHIIVYYQPQINHATGRMVGAEALMRWQHPEYGMQYPSNFIPVLEKHDLIYRADLYVFEQICILLRKFLVEKINPVPISFNMSRHDIYEHDYVSALEEIRQKYSVPVRFLRVEITESSAIGGIELISSVLEQLHEYGYVVEMDDFGSGYSSLNILKDLEIDIIKLDMRFLSGEIGGRGGVIISSIVQMTKWLHTPVIAEGVESMEQAEYMKSIGCNYIQGYLYSRPIPEQEFISKLCTLEHDPLSPPMQLFETMNAGRFWDPASIETLIFSNFVGAAAIFTYENGKTDILRVNDKYVKELGMNMSAKDYVTSNPWHCFDKANRSTYERTLLKAIRRKEEVVCETWRNFESKCCGSDSVCIRSSLRVIGQAGEQYLFYAMVQNITVEKKRYIDLFDSERRFRHASEQANVYAWEYNIATKEMRPCFRCMRDLSLPPLVRNYPEPAIEAGIFPPDYADMYRDWHRQLEEGVGSLEAIIPLTVGRVPFHVRYTTEFDENGKPLIAYGSATLVVDKDNKD